MAGQFSLDGWPPTITIWSSSRSCRRPPARETGRSKGTGLRLTNKRYGRTLCLVDYRQLITIEPGKRSGKPCIRGLRITVSDVLDYLASGMSEDDVLRDFPDLTREDIRACLAFAADRERRLTATGMM